QSRYAGLPRRHKRQPPNRPALLPRWQGRKNRFGRVSAARLFARRRPVHSQEALSRLGTAPRGDWPTPDPELPEGAWSRDHSPKARRRSTDRGGGGAPESPAARTIEATSEYPAAGFLERGDGRKLASHRAGHLIADTNVRREDPRVSGKSS